MNFKNLIVAIIILISMSMFVLSIINRFRHNDIVIKTETEEFIVSEYNIDSGDNCVYFTYNGHVKTICGNYEIIE